MYWRHLCKIVLFRFNPDEKWTDYAWNHGWNHQGEWWNHSLKYGNHYTTSAKKSEYKSSSVRPAYGSPQPYRQWCTEEGSTLSCLSKRVVVGRGGYTDLGICSDGGAKLKHRMGSIYDLEVILNGSWFYFNFESDLEFSGRDFKVLLEGVKLLIFLTHSPKILQIFLI